MHSATTRPESAAARPGADPHARDIAVLTRLRAATAEAHHRVEARIFPSALTDRTSYAAMLRVLLALHEPHEARFGGLGGFAALDVDLASRRKAPRLRADLAALDAPAPPVREVRSPADDDLPAALGAFYVLEGSTLGGRMLLPEVRDRLGDVPTRFLAGYGEQTGRRWRQTRTALVAGVTTASDPGQAADRLVHGAVATFSELGALLDEQGWSTA